MSHNPAMPEITASVSPQPPVGVQECPQAISDDPGAVSEALAGDAAWHEWRRGGIGGSDIGALLGLSSWASPWSVWADKLGLLAPQPETQRQRIGHRMEALLAAEFHDETGLWVAGEQTWCTSREWAVARCTVDGFVLAAAHHEPPGTGDIIGTWQAKTDGRRGWDEVPAHIRAQCVWEMGVTGIHRGWLTVMFAGFRVEHIPVEYDAADWEFMVDRARELWAHVESATPPPVDGSDATRHAIARVHPDTSPGEIADISGLVAEIEQRSAWSDIAADAKRHLAEIDNALRAAIGDAEIGTISGIPAFTLRTQTGRSSTCEACGHVTRGKPFRVLRAAGRSTS